MAKNQPNHPLQSQPRGAVSGDGPATPLLEIFRVGKHRAMDGSEMAFSEADIAASAKTYSPALHEAPIVIGHPRLDAPAYGWIAGLQKKGRSLEAEPRQVSPEFAEMVREGRFKKISSSFYAPDHPRNPAPGVYYLKHVGFLGATAPAVKGMRDPAFADDDPHVVTFEFSEGSDRIIADVFRRFREWLIEKHSMDDADRIVPGWTIDDLQAEAQREASERDMPAETASPAGFSEPQTGELSMNEKELAEREAKLAAERAKLDAEQTAFAEKQAAAAKDAEKIAAFAEQQRSLAAKEADIAARETALREKEEAARIADIEQFADDLCRKEGRMLLKDKPGVVAFLASLPAKGAEIEFADGDDKAVKQSPAEWFRGFLARQPVVVHFGEHAPSGAAGDNNASGLTDRQIADRARKYHADAKERGETISFSDAVDAVRAGKD